MGGYDSVQLASCWFANMAVIEEITAGVTAYRLWQSSKSRSDYASVNGVIESSWVKAGGSRSSEAGWL